MRKEVVKEYQRVSKLIGIEITEDLLKEQVSLALARMLRQGLPKKHLERMLKAARPLGDFSFFQNHMTEEEFEEFFGGPVRKYGLDGSLNHKYGCFGSSTIAEILNLSPWKCNIDTYEAMRGKKMPSDPEKEEVFYAGHMIEPVYRKYFEHMYGDRYVVIECDIQWASRKSDHFIGNVDGLLYDTETDQLGILEIKHTSPRNVKVIDGVKEGEVPEYWDVQERGYMEMLDADFACLFLGWGNRPGLDTNAMSRSERDQYFGESLLEQCEEFMTYNVEAGVKPSYRNVKSSERIKESIAEIYGPVSPKKAPITFDKSFDANMKALVEAEKAIAAAKEKEAKAKEEVKAAEAVYESLQIPIIEKLKDAPKGSYIDADGTHYDVTYDVRNALDVEKVQQMFPAAYEECNKPSVDTAKLKREYPEAYSECFGPKTGSKRSFKLRVWRPTR